MSLKKNKRSVVIDLVKHENEKFQAPASPTAHDFTIVFEGHTIPVSKALLVERCPYFRMMLNSKFQEAETGKVNIKFDVGIDVFTEVLQYIQTGKIVLATANLEGVCRVASYFMLDDLAQLCFNVFEQNTDCETVDHITAFGNANHFPEIAKAALAFKEKHFKAIWKSRLFLEWDITGIEELMKCSGVVAVSENQVFTFVFEWLKFDLDKRLEHATKLFRKLRFSHLRTEKMTEVVKGDTSGRLGQALFEIASEFSGETTPPRIYNEGIYVIGKRYNAKKEDSQLRLERYNPKNGSFKKLRSLGGMDELVVEMVAINDTLYVISVPNENAFLIRVNEYDQSTDTWTARASMDLEYIYVSSYRCCAFEDCIYVFLPDGFVLVYCVTTDIWTHTPLQVPTGYDVQTATACGDSIYLVLISDSSDLSGLMIQLQPSTGKWTEIRCLKQRFLWGFKVVAHGSKLIFVPPYSAEDLVVFDTTENYFMEYGLAYGYRIDDIICSSSVMFNGSIYITSIPLYKGDVATVYNIDASFIDGFGYNNAVIRSSPDWPTKVRMSAVVSID